MVSPLNLGLPKIHIKKVLIKLLVIFFVFWFTVLPSDAIQPIYIRVLVLENIYSMNLKIHGYYEILDQEGRNIIYRGKDLNTTLVGDPRGILLGKVNLGLNRIFIKPVERRIVKLDGREFKGDVQIIKRKEAREFLVVNYIELEEYIKGVLYHEVSHFWPMEALKAQAIISRTFALYQHQTNKNQDYDVRADIYSQVYGGKTSERYRTNRAVKETQGKILLYKGEAFPTYYSATCAGHTEDAYNLWNIDIEPLKGVVCNFCNDSPHFSWRKEISLKDIRDALNKGGIGIAEDIKDISIIKRNKSGRVERMKIYFDNKAKEISGKDFRNAVEPNIIRSTNFKVEVSNKNAYFEGLGWGHGVGLCQWGAYFMAKQGYKYQDILKYYYPESNLSLVAE